MTALTVASPGGPSLGRASAPDRRGWVSSWRTASSVAPAGASKRGVRYWTAQVSRPRHLASVALHRTSSSTRCPRGSGSRRPARPASGDMRGESEHLRQQVGSGAIEIACTYLVVLEPLQRALNVRLRGGRMCQTVLSKRTTRWPCKQKPLANPPFVLVRAVTSKFRAARGWRCPVRRGTFAHMHLVGETAPTPELRATTIIR